MYASYWDAAVITELTDGKVKSVPIESGRRKHPLVYANWLTDLNLRDPAWAAQQKVAVVANYELSVDLAAEDVLGTKELTSFGGYTLYDMPQPDALAKNLE